MNKWNADQLIIRDVIIRDREVVMFFMDVSVSIAKF